MMNIKINKPKFWDKKDLNHFSFLLLPVSLLVEIFNRCKRSIIHPKKFNIFTICVGNLYLGGTGKTPLSIKLSNILKNKKIKNTIIKKYYKDQLDEIRLIKNKTNSLICESSRVDALLKSIKKKNKVAISDDGFQDQSFKKNLSIICFNANQLVGNAQILPAGPLRESLYAIKHSDIVMINGGKNKLFEKKLKNIKKNIEIFYSLFVPRNYIKFKKFKFLAFAGIGNPVNFFNLLKKYNIKVEKKIFFPDHYIITEKEIKQIKDTARKNKLKIITTEKDFLRLKNNQRKNIFELETEYKIMNEKKFTQKILRKIHENY